jgi:hypothetical protein
MKRDRQENKSNQILQPPPNNRHEMGGDPKTIISIYWVSATAEKNTYYVKIIHRIKAIKMCTDVSPVHE